MTRQEQARLGLREIAIEQAQDWGLVPRPYRQSPRLWERGDKYRDQNNAADEQIVELWCYNKDTRTCIFPETLVLACSRGLYRQQVKI